jgi:hypothetical protein
MPVRPLPQFNQKDGKPFEIIINQFNGGTNTLVDEGRVPQNAVNQSTNMMLDQDGVWRVRYGSQPYGKALTGPIDGIGRATVYNADGTATNYLFAIDNGAIKYCKDGGAWATIAGNTWTTGNNANMVQVNSRLYICNGKDNLAYVDLTTMATTPTIVKYTALSTPGAPTPTRTVLTAGSYNIYYKITAVKASIGETAASVEATITVNKQRSAWKTDFSEYISLTWTAVTGADSYNIYYSDTAGQEIFIDSASVNTYNDYGQTTPNPYQAAPATDGTAGPPASTMVESGNRIWMTGNPVYPYRIYWSGTGQYLGSFNPFYGGGYIDLNLGGDEKPIGLQHYRDGKGNQTLIALTSSPVGGGSVWFIPLTTLTVDTLTIVIPSALSQGTIGTTSTRGVVQAVNNVFYPSIKGFQSVGSAQQILNVLVTSEVSTQIRPSVKGISNSAASSICGIYYYGRIFWSVPYGSSTNNQIWVLDLERQAWCIYWSIGVKQFLEYSSSDGTVHLLAVPVSGTNLIEFSENFIGDSSVATPVNLKSGLISWDKNHFEFAWVEKVYFELGRPKGNVSLTVSGTAVNKNLSSLKSISVTDTVSSAGVGSDLVGSFEVGTSNNAPTTYSQASVKKVLYINKPLNNLEWQITSSDVNASFTLLEVGIVGNILPSGDPSSWRK